MSCVGAITLLRDTSTKAVSAAQQQQHRGPVQAGGPVLCFPPAAKLGVESGAGSECGQSCQGSRGTGPCGVQETWLHAPLHPHCEPGPGPRPLLQTALPTATKPQLAAGKVVSETTVSSYTREFYFPVDQKRSSPSVHGSVSYSPNYKA